MEAFINVWKKSCFSALACPEMLQAVCIDSMLSVWDLKTTCTFDQKTVYKSRVCAIMTMSSFISFNMQKHANSRMTVGLLFSLSQMIPSRQICYLWAKTWSPTGATSEVAKERTDLHTTFEKQRLGEGISGERMIEWFGLEGTLQITKFQSPN